MESIEQCIVPNELVRESSFPQLVCASAGLKIICQASQQTERTRAPVPCAGQNIITDRLRLAQRKQSKQVSLRASCVIFKCSRAPSLRMTVGARPIEPREGQNVLKFCRFAFERNKNITSPFDLRPPTTRSKLPIDISHNFITPTNHGS